MDASEWVTYPDPGIPAIVSEELWNRANALYKERRKEVMDHTGGTSFHNRYPYSAKIICEEHGVTFHRHVLKKKSGKEEAWQCKVYRTHGSKACTAPQIRSCELDQIMSRIFAELAKDKHAVTDSLLAVLENVHREVDYGKLRSKIHSGIDMINTRKERLLDLHIAGTIAIDEFKARNDGCNDQLRKLKEQLAAIDKEEAEAAEGNLDMDRIRRVLEMELDFSNGVNSALVSTILEKVVVKKESTRKEIHLNICLKLGQQYEAVYSPEKMSASIIRLRNTIPKAQTRRI